MKNPLFLFVCFLFAMFQSLSVFGQGDISGTIDGPRKSPLSNSGTIQRHYYNAPSDPALNAIFQQSSADFNATMATWNYNELQMKLQEAQRRQAVEIAQRIALEIRLRNERAAALERRRQESPDSESGLGEMERPKRPSGKSIADRKTKDLPYDEKNAPILNDSDEGNWSID